MASQGNLLLADDEEMYLTTLAQLLRMHGFTVTCCGSVPEARELLEKHRYDLLVSDIQMPGGPVLDLVKRIPERNAGLPVVLMTGHPTMDTALERASSFLRKAHLPLYACALGQPQKQPVPAAGPTGGAGGELLFSQAQPDFLKQLAQANGGRLLPPGEDPAPLYQRLAQGREPLPLARSLLPAHPEWGAWIALAGLGLWLAAAGKPMRAWRPFLGLLLALGLGLPARAELPQSLRAWKAQAALDAGDLATARAWMPRGDLPLQRLVAAEIQLQSSEFQPALESLGPLIGQGSPRATPAWRGPALLLAAKAWTRLGHPEEARRLLERLLLEQPGRPEAIHNLQTLLKDPLPPPPHPRKPPPPPPPKPSQAAQQDEMEGLKQRMPRNGHPPGGVKDL